MKNFDFTEIQKENLFKDFRKFLKDNNTWHTYYYEVKQRPRNNVSKKNKLRFANFSDYIMNCITWRNSAKGETFWNSMFYKALDADRFRRGLKYKMVGKFF